MRADLKRYCVDLTFAPLFYRAPLVCFAAAVPVWLATGCRVLLFFRALTDLRSSLNPVSSRSLARSQPRKKQKIMHGAHGSSRRVRPADATSSESAASSASLLSAAENEAHYAPVQLFRAMSSSSGQPASFSSLPRIVLQLVYGFLSLTEIGVSCRTCRDMHQTAALYRCPLNTAKGGIRERWLSLDRAYDCQSKQ
jgi:hypothetical protein